MTSVSTDRRQGLNSGAAVKVPCRAATTANITLSGEKTIDGVALVTDDRVLVKDQTDTTENGIYVVDTGDWSRDKDFDGDFDVKKGTFVYVTDGTTNTGFWYVTTTDPEPGSAMSLSRASSVLSAVSAFMQTMLDDASASVALTTLGFSAFVKTLVDDASANAFLTTLTTTRAEAGAAAVPVLTKLREVVTPADFGAVGDLTTDDTTALAAAIATGKHVDLAGLGYLTQGLTLATAGQKIFNGKLKLKNATNQSVITVSANRCKVLDVEIDGNKANQTTVTNSLGSGIALSDGVSNIEIWDPYIHDCRREGISGFGNHNDCLVIGGEIKDCGHAQGMMLIAPSQDQARPSKRWLISGLTLSGFKDAAIGTVAIQNSVISGNRVVIANDGVAISCIALESGCHHTTVFGNTCEGSASVANPLGAGIQVNDCHDVVVIGNTCKGLSKGVFVPSANASAYNIHLKDNTLYDCGYAGNAIEVVAAAGPYDASVIVSGNTLRDCPYGGIQISGITHALIVNNSFNGVNLQNSASKRFVSAICLLNQSFYNTVTGNVILEGATGNLKIGIHEMVPSAGNGSGVNTIRDNRIIGADFDIMCSGTAQSLTGYSKVTRTLDTAVTAVPTTGHWERGDVVWNEQPASGGAPGWACTTTGTFSATATTGSITTGTNQLTVASAVGLYAGMAVRVAGAGIAAANLDTYILAFDGTGLVCSLRDNASTSVVAAAVSTPAALNPVFKAMANLA